MSFEAFKNNLISNLKGAGFSVKCDENGLDITGINIAPENSYGINFGGQNPKFGDLKYCYDYNSGLAAFSMDDDSLAKKIANSIKEEINAQTKK